MKKLSVVIIAKNEEKNIGDCIKSVNFADEIVVIDDFSSDKTVEIAKKNGARVYRRKLDNFANQRNFGIEKAHNDWILFIDADERVTPDLAEEIKRAVDGEKRAYKIPRRNEIFRKFFQHTDWYPDEQLRLFKKDNGRYVRSVHEQVEVKGEVGVLKKDLLHYNYDSINQFLRKNFFHYADLETRILIDSGYEFNWRDLISKPVSEFLRRFFLTKGYKEGVHGLVASLLISFTVFVVYAKVWEKEGFKKIDISMEEFRRKATKTGKEINYWLNEVEDQEQKNIINKFFAKIKSWIS